MLGWLIKKWLWLSIFSESATLQRLAEGAAKLRCALAEEVCNRYDLLIVVPCFLLANHNDCSRWFAFRSSSLHLFAVRGLVFRDEITKK
jgi:hypothetical protein